MVAFRGMASRFTGSYAADYTTSLLRCNLSLDTLNITSSGSGFVEMMRQLHMMVAAVNLWIKEAI